MLSDLDCGTSEKIIFPVLIVFPLMFSELIESCAILVCNDRYLESPEKTFSVIIFLYILSNLLKDLETVPCGMQTLLNANSLDNEAR